LPTKQNKYSPLQLADNETEVVCHIKLSETSVSNYQSVLRNIPEKPISENTTSYLWQLQK